MNRREFFGRLLVAQTAFMVLPAARTYRRTWRALFCQREDGLFVPDYSGGVIQSPFEAFMDATNNLNAALYKRWSGRSPWLQLLHKTCPPETEALSGLTVERSLPSAWTKLIQ